jgi:hypothetical protein
MRLSKYVTAILPLTDVGRDERRRRQGCFDVIIVRIDAIPRLEPGCMASLLFVG